jgi:fermentation-respiration switch protein FrsA (DUF1100 family)
MPDTLTFQSGSDRCEAWHFTAADDSLATPAGRPIVVMAHGFGGTKDTGLESFGKGLAAAGVDVFAFDYRGFGASGGIPRQNISLTGQVEDYRAALRAAAALPGVDPDRLVLWGVSLSGGTVLEVAAGRTDLAAVIALTPLVSGPAAAKHSMPFYEAATSAKSAALGVRSKASRKDSVLIPIVGRPDEASVLAIDGMYDDYVSIAGPTWRNEVDAAIVLDILRHRPHRFAAQMPCPALFQIADHDRCAPPHAAAKAAVKARALVHHYPCDHFDVYDGRQWYATVLEHQVRFLQRVLTPGATYGVVIPADRHPA